MLDIFLPIKPAPKARPRFTKSGRVYTSAKTMQAERAIRVFLISEMHKASLEITDKLLSVEMIFNYSIKKRLRNEITYKVSRPDIDNLIKLCMDSMNGIVFVDDRQVVEIFARKVYSDRDGIELRVQEVGDGN